MNLRYPQQSPEMFRYFGQMTKQESCSKMGWNETPSGRLIASLGGRTLVQGRASWMDTGGAGEPPRDLTASVGVPGNDEQTEGSPGPKRDIPVESPDLQLARQVPPLTSDIASLSPADAALFDIATIKPYFAEMKRTEQQIKLFNERIPRQFGGMLLKGNAKVARPLSTKHAIHLVIKSQLAVGKRSFLQSKNAGRIEGIVRRTAVAKGIRIYHFVNVGNHLHLVIKLDRSTLLAGRRAFHSFIRSVTGLIARHVLSAERNHARGIKFWQARPFTRLVSWGRDYNRVHRYMAKNADQARERIAIADWGFGITDPERIIHLETG